MFEMQENNRKTYETEKDIWFDKFFQKLSLPIGEASGKLISCIKKEL